LRAARGRGPRLAAIAASCRWHAGRLGPFDVIEAPDFHGLGTFLPRRRTILQLQTPAAVIAREDPRTPEPTRGTTWLERRGVRRATSVLSISQLLVDELRGMGWLGDRSVDVVAPLVDLDAPPLGPPRGDPPTVLGIGRIEPRKGFDLLVDAVASTATAGVRLELAGADTPDAEGRRWSADLVRHAEGRGVDLVLLGQVDRDGVRAALARSSVVAIPSTFDSFNLAGLEALAAGRPVVLSPRVGLAERADGTGALQVAERTAPAFAAALDAVLGAPPPAARERAAAARRLAERFDPVAFAQDRARRYASVVAAVEG
jgi:glycosyltransferase involved in cell wall biosynthesis